MDHIRYAQTSECAWIRHKGVCKSGVKISRRWNILIWQNRHLLRWYLHDWKVLLLDLLMLIPVFMVIVMILIKLLLFVILLNLIESG